MKCPVTLIHGTEGGTALPGEVKRFLDGHPKTRVVKVEGAGHFLPMERPDVVQDEINRMGDFLRPHMAVTNAKAGSFQTRRASIFLPLYPRMPRPVIVELIPSDNRHRPACPGDPISLLPKKQNGSPPDKPGDDDVWLIRKSLRHWHHLRGYDDGFTGRKA